MFLIEFLLGAWVAWSFIQLAIVACHAGICIILMQFAFAVDIWKVMKGQQKLREILSFNAVADLRDAEECDEDEWEWWLYSKSFGSDRCHFGPSATETPIRDYFP